MVKQEYANRLREKASSLPLSPGIYIMKNKAGNIIYVGKSKKLKNRVSQYFHESDFQSYKTDMMTSQIYDFDYILCSTEIEALSLENNLIKLHKPKYNIKLKDDKSYPYIALKENDDYPRFFMTRQRNLDGVKYFGPYTGISVVFDVIRAINRTFSLPSCKYSFPKDKGKITHCIYKQIGCIAPCKIDVTKEEYKERLNLALDFLSGNHTTVISKLQSAMLKASDEMQFELAASYRDQIRSINKLYDKQKVVADPGIDRDVIGYYESGNISCICVLYIRDGKLQDSEYEYFSGGEIIESNSLTTFLFNLYSNRACAPNELDLPSFVSDDDVSLISEWLFEKYKKKSKIHKPIKGAKEKLLQLANENANQKCIEYAKKKTNYELATIRLASIANLEVVPNIIEAFDISNLGNENIKAGLVVFKDGKPLKSSYRIFNIKSVDHEDDYTSMKEAVKRHIGDIKEGKSIMPDLILIDGGIGHVSSVKSVMDEEDIALPYLGMVKNDKHITRALVSNDGLIDISLEKEVYALIYKIQEEVHRFTVSNMMNKKVKSYKRLSIENIKGIGPKKAKMLMNKFGTITKIKSASEEELTSIPGITNELAQALISYLNKGEEK